jgi:hypothetical protein
MIKTKGRGRLEGVVLIHLLQNLIRNCRASATEISL